MYIRVQIHMLFNELNLKHMHHVYSHAKAPPYTKQHLGQHACFPMQRSATCYWKHVTRAHEERSTIYQYSVHVWVLGATRRAHLVHMTFSSV